MSAGITPTVRLTSAPETSAGRERLSDDRLAMLRAMLEEQRAFRIDQLSELLRTTPQSPLGSAEPEILRSLRRAAVSALREVQGALWRMEEGTYGRCTRCGGAIPLERLEILPQAARCAECHRRAES